MVNPIEVKTGGVVNFVVAGFQVTRDNNDDHGDHRD